MHVKRGEINTSPGSLATLEFPDTDKVRLYESKHHVRNFVECVRDHKPTVAPIDDAVEADLFCIACDTAIRLDKPLRWDPAREEFIDSPEANARRSRPMRAPWKL